MRLQLLLIFSVAFRILYRDKIINWNTKYSCFTLFGLFFICVIVVDTHRYLSVNIYNVQNQLISQMMLHLLFQQQFLSAFEQCKFSILLYYPKIFTSSCKLPMYNERQSKHAFVNKITTRCLYNFLALKFNVFYCVCVGLYAKKNCNKAKTK